MILRDHDVEIRRTDPYRRKFADAMTEYLHQLSLDSSYDAASGDVDCSTGWFAIFGRRILREDSQGFVWTETFPDATAADAAYDLLNVEYAFWADSEEE